VVLAGSGLNARPRGDARRVWGADSRAAPGYWYGIQKELTMKHAFAAVAVVLAGSLTWAAAPEPCFESTEHFTTWVGNYYKSPEPDKLPCAVTYFAGSDLFTQKHTVMPFVHFCAAAIGRDQAVLENVQKAVLASDATNTHVVSLNIYWILDTDEARAMVKQVQAEKPGAEVDRICKKMADLRPKPILERPIAEPATIDNLWATFYATGDVAPIERIVSVLALAKQGEGQEQAVGKAAQETLAYEAAQEERVRSIVTELAPKQDEATKAMLDEILAHAAKPEAPAKH
jgi:hypothetical protein